MLRNFSIKHRLLANSAVVGAAMLLMLALLVFQSRQLSEIAELQVEVAQLNRAFMGAYEKPPMSWSNNLKL